MNPHPFLSLRSVSTSRTVLLADWQRTQRAILRRIDPRLALGERRRRHPSAHRFAGAQVYHVL